MSENDHSTNYQRTKRIFSLQLKKLPIRIQMKEMFTINYALLKSVNHEYRKIYANQYKYVRFEFCRSLFWQLPILLWCCNLNCPRELLQISLRVTKYIFWMVIVSAICPFKSIHLVMHPEEMMGTPKR